MCSRHSSFPALKSPIPLSPNLYLLIVCRFTPFASRKELFLYLVHRDDLFSCFSCDFSSTEGFSLSLFDTQPHVRLVILWQWALLQCAIVSRPHPHHPWTNALLVLNALWQFCWRFLVNKLFLSMTNHKNPQISQCWTNYCIRLEVACLYRLFR